MSPHGPVLFINKSAKSKTLTRSEGAERKEIYSHVQQLPVLKTSEKTQIVGWDVSVAANCMSDGKTKYSSRRSADQDGSRCRRKKAKGLSKAKTDQDISAWDISRILSRATLPITALKGSKLDPFDCSAVPIDGRMTDILKECSLHPLSNPRRILRLTTILQTATRSSIASSPSSPGRNLVSV